MEGRAEEYEKNQDRVSGFLEVTWQKLFPEQSNACVKCFSEVKLDEDWDSTAGFSKVKIIQQQSSRVDPW
jgi:hypothetical protein